MIKLIKENLDIEKNIKNPFGRGWGHSICYNTLGSISSMAKKVKKKG
jgi:hypothetical protein